MKLLQLLAQEWRRVAKSQARLFSSHIAEKGELITHVAAGERPSLSAIADKLMRIQEGLKNQTTLSASERARLSKEAEHLSEFELGRFLIANQGALSGWWTYYCILGFKKKKITNPVERFLLEEAPIILATRERFGHFQNITRQLIETYSHTTPQIKIATMPGGMAADLLTLKGINPARCQLQFVNIDLDASVFSLAQQLAAEMNCIVPLEFRKEDGWSLKAREEFDVVLSNGLNIYVPEREKVIALYESILKTLKPGGTLVTSALTPPLSMGASCEWRHDEIDKTALARQVGIFAHILKATWSNFCTTEEMFKRLQEAGFADIRVIPDRRNMFPTFIGHKNQSVRQEKSETSYKI